jgi:hypothetical protein
MAFTYGPDHTSDLGGERERLVRYECGSTLT